MKKNILAICDNDINYSERLMDNLLKRDSFPFEIHIYKDGDKMLKSLKTSPVQVLLITTSIYKTIDSFSDEFIILLSEGENSIDNRPCIFKYQSASSIKARLLEILAQNHPESCCQAHINKRAKFIGIYSPISRCGQTSSTLLLGQRLAHKQKVLYLNFEPFSGSKYFFNTNTNSDLTNLLYFASSSPDKILLHLESMITSIDGLDVLAPAFSFKDLAHITKEEWISFFQLLEAQCNYDVILLDLSEVIAGLFDILRLCTLIVSFKKNDKISAAKLNHYGELLKYLGYEDVYERTLFIDTPEINDLPGCITDLEFSTLSPFVVSITNTITKKLEPEANGI